MIKNNRQNRFYLGLGMALTLVFGLNSVAVAQSGTDDRGYQSNEKGNGIYGDAPAGLDPLDIMHRAQQANGRSAEEFNAESQTQIDSSASDFKRLQQQRILEQQSVKTKTEIEQVETTETAE